MAGGRPRHRHCAPRDHPVEKASREGEPTTGSSACCTTEFARRLVDLEFPDGTTAQLCLDTGEIRAVCDGRMKRAPIAEVEIELDARQRGQPVSSGGGAGQGSAPRSDDRNQGRARLCLAARPAARHGHSGACDDGRRSPPTRPPSTHSRPSRANACTRSPRTCRASWRTTIPNGSTRCGSARDACARASRSWRRSRPRPVRPGGRRGQVARDPSGQGAGLGCVRDADAAAAHRLVRPRRQRRRPASGACASARCAGDGPPATMRGRRSPRRDCNSCC